MQGSRQEQVSSSSLSGFSPALTSAVGLRLLSSPAGHKHLLFSLLTHAATSSLAFATSLFTGPRHGSSSPPRDASTGRARRRLPRPAQPPAANAATSSGTPPPTVAASSFPGCCHLLLQPLPPPPAVATASNRSQPLPLPPVGAAAPSGHHRYLTPPSAAMNATADAPSGHRLFFQRPPELPIAVTDADAYSGCRLQR
ncbi:proline-rich receptor-like protein kinase PERK12 [Zingiber officinale]|uniref:proline-rich receptor-like protein kinase PERK12 n=1 Tax=Zingiber officinale TaxID=94328 RepID=UPI001C4A77B0|nr:proline-rich receptor-like protein kinase PERK12 [Zingiber officinale]